MKAKIEDGVVSYVAQACGGDIRKAMNAVELLFSASGRKDGEVALTLADAKQITQRSAMRYDRAGDEHYERSVRAHEVHPAALTPTRQFTIWLRLSGGQRFAQRVPADSRSACEDIGLAYPQAVAIVKACVVSALQLGFRRRGFRWQTR